MYQKDHREDGRVIEALKAVVLARANERLFADGVLEGLCIASGGNLRDLFELIRSGMLSARVRFADAISFEDARVAVAELRDKYKQRLGSTGEESTETPLADKLNRLVGIYEGEDRTEEVPDPVLSSSLETALCAGV